MKKLKIKNLTSQNATRTTQKGITLVALVITIIILLILAGVAINMAINSGGLFAKAGEAAQKWNESVKQEEIILSELLGATEVYKDGVNAPRLGTNMIPVYYDNGWKKADSENAENNWYEYDTSNKQWANTVTVKETSRSKYLNATEGTAIAEEDIIGMFVWIPRYAYRITEGYHPNETAELPIEGNIEIKFLKGTTDEYEGGTAVRTNVTNGENYVVHPAFTSDTTNGGGSKETIGFWVAKFEASSNTTTADNPNTGDKYGHTNNETDQVTVRPNVTSWRYITVSQIYQVCKNMNAEGNIHGLTSTVNPHMMKNSEWGAVAYLTQSDYGNKQTIADDSSGVWNNPYHEGDIKVETGSITRYYTTMTGIVGSKRDEGIHYATKATATVNKSNSETISITYLNYTTGGITSGSEYTKIYYRYQTEQGQKGSSTRNIYGVYDLAGGVWEYVAGYLAAGSNDYATFFKNLPGDEKQEYLGRGDDNDEGGKVNFQSNYAKYGDAIWETTRYDGGGYLPNPINLSWNGDCSIFVYVSKPFLSRGGRFNNADESGIFASIYAMGVAGEGTGFRPVIGV